MISWIPIRRASAGCARARASTRPPRCRPRSSAAGRPGCRAPSRRHVPRHAARRCWCPGSCGRHRCRRTLQPRRDQVTTARSPSHPVERLVSRRYPGSRNGTRRSSSQPRPIRAASTPTSTAPTHRPVGRARLRTEGLLTRAGSSQPSTPQQYEAFLYNGQRLDTTRGHDPPHTRKSSPVGGSTGLELEFESQHAVPLPVGWGRRPGPQPTVSELVCAVPSGSRAARRRPGARGRASTFRMRLAGGAL